VCSVCCVCNIDTACVQSNTTAFWPWAAQVQCQVSRNNLVQGQPGKGKLPKMPALMPV
jgi:hypothetical protein